MFILEKNKPAGYIFMFDGIGNIYKNQKSNQMDLDRSYFLDI